MSTNNQISEMKDNSDKFLEPFIDAARDDVSADSYSEAADRLRAQIPEPQTSAWQGIKVFRFSAAAVMLALVLLAGQTFMPGYGSSAFAAVQKWFGAFQNVHVNTRISSGDSVVVNVEVWALANGTVRIEQSGMVQILDSEAATFYMLLPDQRYFTQPLPVNPEKPQALDWFKDIREFQGEATMLQETRTVAGIDATGYQLRVDDVDLTLWAEPVSHRPLLLEGALPGGLQMVSTLDFDNEMAADLFEVPEGYQQVESEEE
jgi:hypothetical protein